MNTDYKIVAAKDIPALEAAVVAEFQNNWDVHGNPFNANGIWYQVMVLPAPPTPPGP